jgi:hypothetical protein
VIDVANRKPFRVRFVICVDPGECKDAFNSSTFCESVQQFNMRPDRCLIWHGYVCCAGLVGLLRLVHDRRVTLPLRG